MLSGPPETAIAKFLVLISFKILLRPFNIIFPSEDEIIFVLESIFT